MGDFKKPINENGFMKDIFQTTKNDYMEYAYKRKNEIYNKEYNIPYEILMTLKYVSLLKYDAVPNYEYITGIFKNWITII